MATSDYWSSADLKAIAAGGFINEDLMQQIIDISEIPLPFTDIVGVGDPADQAYTEWPIDKLAAPDTTNAVVDGADAAGHDATGANMKRVGNHCQQSDKVVEVTERAIASDTLAGALSYQLDRRSKELRRDLEAIMLIPQASVADNGDAVAGKVGSFPAWLTSNVNNGAGGSNGGFNTGTKLVTAPTPATARRAFSIATMWKALILSIYNNNGDARYVMSIPQMTQGLSDYIRANAATLGYATPTSNVSGTGGGVNQTMQGYFSIVITDFGYTLTIVPNRLMQTYNDGSAAASTDVLYIDPNMVEMAFLIPFRAKPLAKLGTAERWQMLVDWTLRVKNEAAHGIARTINHTAAVTA